LRLRKAGSRDGIEALPRPARWPKRSLRFLSA
jgi:hypothetical protein